MSFPHSDLGGIPRGRGKVGVSQAKTVKLRRNSLQRRARALGFELRHSAYGYSLIDPAREQVDDRNDMTLDDVESCLAQS